jgi:hypothetical protein
MLDLIISAAILFFFGRGILKIGFWIIGVIGKAIIYISLITLILYLLCAR